MLLYLILLRIYIDAPFNFTYIEKHDLLIFNMIDY